MMLRAWVWLQLLTVRPRRGPRLGPGHHIDARILAREDTIADIQRQVWRLEHGAEDDRL